MRLMQLEATHPHGNQTACRMGTHACLVQPVFSAMSFVWPPFVGGRQFWAECAGDRRGGG